MDLGKILSSKNNSVLVDYLLFLLKKKQDSIILEKLDNELQSQIDANRTVHNCGAQYETYAYLKKR